MKRLTEKDESGNWCLRGMPWKSLYIGNPMTQEAYEKLYGALWKLMEYEDTGLTPEEVMDGKMLTGWIPVEERLPETEDGYIHVMVSMDDDFVCTTDYTDDDGFELWDDSGEVVAWMPLPEPYRPE